MYVLEISDHHMGDTWGNQDFRGNHVG